MEKKRSHMKVESSKPLIVGGLNFSTWDWKMIFLAASDLGQVPTTNFHTITTREAVNKCRKFPHKTASIQLIL